MCLKKIFIVIILFSVAEVAVSQQEKKSRRKDIIGIDVLYEQNQNISPGMFVQIDIIGKQNNGKDVKLKWGKLKDYKITVSGGEWKDDGILIFSDPAMIPDFRITLDISSLKDPSVNKIVSFLLNFKGQFYANYDGVPGMQGEGVNDRGTPLIFRDGLTGRDGGQGGAGKDGDSIHVFIQAYHDSILNAKLLKIYVDSKTKDRKTRFIVNTDGGNIDISVRGGIGGNGGNGGGGGTGHDYKLPKDGKDGKPGGDGGDGGCGGTGGTGGVGGKIVVYVDPSAESYIHLVSFDNSGGQGGIGGLGGSGGKGGDAGPQGSGLSAGINGKQGSSGKSGTTGIAGPPVKYLYQAVNIVW